MDTKLPFAKRGKIYRVNESIEKQQKQFFPLEQAYSNVCQAKILTLSYTYASYRVATSPHILQTTKSRSRPIEPFFRITVATFLGA